MWGVSLTHPVLASFLAGKLLFDIPCWLYFSVWSFFYTSSVGFIFIWEFLLHIPCWLYYSVCLTHPVLALFLCWELLLHIPCWLCFSWEFLLHIPCCLHFYRGSFSYTPRVVLIFMQGVSLTHPMLASSFFFFYFVIWGVSLKHLVLVYFFIRGISVTHPVLASFLSGEFLLHIPCWL